MHASDRKGHRQVFVKAWAKSRSGQPLTPLETQIVQILKLHPEYHGLLEHPDKALDRDWLPEGGDSNPFLHLGLHLAIVEQLSLDQPAGIRRLHRTLVEACGDLHEAEHRILQCLAEAIWRVHHDGRPFEDKAYLKCIKRLGGGTRPRG